MATVHSSSRHTTRMMAAASGPRTFSIAGARALRLLTLETLPGRASFGPTLVAFYDMAVVRLCGSPPSRHHRPPAVVPASPTRNRLPLDETANTVWSNGRREILGREEDPLELANCGERVLYAVLPRGRALVALLLLPPLLPAAPAASDQSEL